ncbi:MAG: arylesterase [Alphaproteobacteria bacterium]|nr:arylesterase [Alphaproteobacteria bacterium]
MKSIAQESRGSVLSAIIGLIALLVTGQSGAGDAARSWTVLALGDSLTAGYGLDAKDAFAVRLEAALRAHGRDVTVINAGVSGDTSAGGLARLDWLLAGREIDAAIVELGANDGLRGLDPAATRANLEQILTRLKTKGARVLLSGMLAPPNLGPDYGQAFNGLYPALAEAHGVAFDPFFLEGVATVPELNQEDGIHPNSDGITKIVNRITPLIINELLMK